MIFLFLISFHSFTFMLASNGSYFGTDAKLIRYTISNLKPSSAGRILFMAFELTGKLLHKRKDFIATDEAAQSHPNRTYYYRQTYEPDEILAACTTKLTLDPDHLPTLQSRTSTFMKLKVKTMLKRRLLKLQKNLTHLTCIY